LQILYLLAIYLFDAHFEIKKTMRNAKDMQLILSRVKNLIGN